MLKAQKKISRKEIKEDQLVTTYFTARTWIEQNRRLVNYIVGSVVVLVVAIVVWTQKQKDWNETATTLLARISPVYEQARYEEAINGVPQEGAQGLETIVQEYGSTPAGEIAKLYLANSYAALGQYEKALEYYDDVDLDDPLLYSAALAGKGICLEHLGRYEEAAKSFEKAAVKGLKDIQAAENFQRAALNYASAGEKEKAIELLTKIKKEYPTSPAARDVEMLLAQVSA